MEINQLQDSKELREHLGTDKWTSNCKELVGFFGTETMDYIDKELSYQLPAHMAQFYRDSELFYKDTKILTTWNLMTKNL